MYTNIQSAQSTETYDIFGCNSEGTQKKAINAYALRLQYRVLFVNKMNKICS